MGGIDNPELVETEAGGLAEPQQRLKGRRDVGKTQVADESA